MDIARPTANTMPKSGRVIARYSHGIVKTYIYGNGSGKIEKTIAVDTTSNDLLTTDYFYENGLLVREEKSDGKKISLQHDSLGRISKLVSGRTMDM